MPRVAASITKMRTGVSIILNKTALNAVVSSFSSFGGRLNVQRQDASTIDHAQVIWPYTGTRLESERQSFSTCDAACPIVIGFFGRESLTTAILERSITLLAMGAPGSQIWSAPATFFGCSVAMRI